MNLHQAIKEHSQMGSSLTLEQLQSVWEDVKNLMPPRMDSSGNLLMEYTTAAAILAWAGDLTGTLSPKDVQITMNTITAYQQDLIKKLSIPPVQAKVVQCVQRAIVVPAQLPPPSRLDQLPVIDPEDLNEEEPAF